MVTIKDKNKILKNVSVLEKLSFKIYIYEEKRLAALKQLERMLAVS